MPTGFFASGEIPSTTHQGLLPRCGQCGLSKTCSTPKLSVVGGGAKGILIILDAPTKEADLQKNSYAGAEIEFLSNSLRRYGINLKKDCWLTFALICRPPDMRKDLSLQISSCRPSIRKIVQELKPVVIMPMGYFSITSLIRVCWDGDVDMPSRWIGWTIPDQKRNAWICPNYSPSLVADATKMVNNPRPDKITPLLFFKHLKKACEKSEERPWNGELDIRSKIEVIYDPKKVARIIRTEIAENPNQITAFDYEANMLKPDAPTSKIWSNAICFRGRRTIAYPWVGEAIVATREYIRCPMRKIASNLKYEARWTLKMLKTHVHNWWWDTMIAAHVLNPEFYTASVKFQAYVLLGLPLWNRDTEKLLEAEGDSCYSENRIGEISLDALLLYNGIDAFAEYWVAMAQRKGFKDVTK